MRPTMELRIAKLPAPQGWAPGVWSTMFAAYQFQQKWISDDASHHEWRAVPVVDAPASPA